jgi:hypothetical protein
MGADQAQGGQHWSSFRVKSPKYSGGFFSMIKTASGLREREGMYPVVL